MARVKQTEPPTSVQPDGSAKPPREDVAWQLETALTELSHGNLLNVMVHSQRAAAMALELCESRRGSPNEKAHPTAAKATVDGTENL